MKFCTRCGSKMINQQICRFCQAPAFRAASEPIVEYPAAGDLRSFHFSYTVYLFGFACRERSLWVPFSYINGTLLEIRTSQDAGHSVPIKFWSAKDDPLSGSCDPIVGKEIQPTTRSGVRLRLGSGVERSFLLSQVRPHSKRGNKVGLIFPAPIVRALNPVYDHAAIAAVDYTANSSTWSTTHPEIHAIRSQLPDDQDDAFTNSLANYLNGLCRQCLRLFKVHQGNDQRRYGVGAGQAGLIR